MKLQVRFCALMVSLPLFMRGQNDSVHLVCPLNEATVVLPPKNSIRYDETDFCIAMVSITDTVVKAVTDGRVTNVVKSDEEDGKWDVVLSAKFRNKEYYFWYSGINRVLVKRNEVIKERQPMGYIKPGEQIELLMFDFETPVDPARYLDCKFLKERERIVKVVGRMKEVDDN